jgi:hypothetical protein
VNSQHLIIQSIKNLVPDAIIIIHNDGSIEWQNPKIAPITQDQIDVELLNTQNQQKLDECVSQAKALLFNTDYSQLSDVKLQNKNEFIEYRLKVREIANNPVLNPAFPTPPTPIWVVE